MPRPLMQLHSYFIAIVQTTEIKYNKIK